MTGKLRPGRSSRTAARIGSGLALVVGLVVLSACSESPKAPSYTFHSDRSAVKVDTPQLRQVKARAGIQQCPATRSSAAQVSGGLPDATLPCLGGGPSVDLAALRGPLLLNFWSQTCGPCRVESPILQRFASAAGGKVKVIGVDFYDPQPSLALEFDWHLGITYPQIADPDAATKASLHISGLPMTFLVDRSGRVAYTQVGAIRSDNQLAQLVEDHLGVSDPLGSGR